MSGGPTVALDGDVVGVNSSGSPMSHKRSTSCSRPRPWRRCCAARESRTPWGRSLREYRAGLNAYFAGDRDAAVEDFEAVLQVVPSHHPRRSTCRRQQAAGPSTSPLIWVFLGVAALLVWDSLGLRWARGRRAVARRRRCRRPPRRFASRRHRYRSGGRTGCSSPHRALNGQETALPPTQAAADSAASDAGSDDERLPELRKAARRRRPSVRGAASRCSQFPGRPARTGSTGSPAPLGSVGYRCPVFVVRVCEHVRTGVTILARRARQVRPRWTSCGDPSMQPAILGTSTPRMAPLKLGTPSAGRNHLEVVAPVSPFRQHLADRGDSLRMCVVHQDDRTRLCDPVQALNGPARRVRRPVLDVGGPQDGLEAQRDRCPGDPCVDQPVRRAHAGPHRTTDGPTCGDQFFAYPLRAHVGEPRMPPRVVADGVTVTVHTPDLAGVGVGWTAGDEEGRVRVVAAQRGQQPRGVAKDHRRTSDREPCRWSGDRPRPRTSPGFGSPCASAPVHRPCSSRRPWLSAPRGGVDRKCHCWNRGG